MRVTPRASRDEIAGMHGAALKVRLRSPPVDGAANDALVRFLAHILGVPRNNIHIVSGRSSRNKLVEASGVTAEQIQALARRSRTE